MKTYKTWIARDKDGLHLFWGIPELGPYGWDLEGLFEDSQLNKWVDLPNQLFPEIKEGTCAEFKLVATLNPTRFPYYKRQQQVFTQEQMTILSDLLEETTGKKHEVLLSLYQQLKQL